MEGLDKKPSITSYFQYDDGQKRRYFARMEKYKEDKVPVEQWDSEVKLFSELYDKYLYDESTDANTYGGVNPH